MKTEKNIKTNLLIILFSILPISIIIGSSFSLVNIVLLSLCFVFIYFSKSGINCHCLIRADLFEKPVIGAWLKRNGCIPASRSTREEAEKRAITELNSGHAVAIMPEGRLVPPDERPDGVGQGRPGISRIARATGAKIVPVAIEGSEIVWPLGRAFPIPKLKKPLVSVRFGTPFHLTSDDDIENAETIMNSIRDLLTEGKDL